MEHEQQSPDSSPGRGLSPVAPAVRQRLQKVFDHALRCIEKKDHDYANQLLTQCVVEDPGNLIYLQHFFSNLQKKYKDNKKGARMAGLKIKSHRSSLVKYTSKGLMEDALKSGCAALSLNPWETQTLLAMAATCSELQARECQLFHLRTALKAEPQNIEVNRQAGMALQQLGQFEQAIACWRRVQQAKPDDEESRRAIAGLSVEKTIHDGGYDSTVVAAQDGETASASSLSVAMHARDAMAVDTNEPQLSPEERMKLAIEGDPSDTENYMRLSDIYLHEHRFEEAESILIKAQQVAGGADFQIVERIEDVRMRRINHQLVIAERQCQTDPSDENKQLFSQYLKQVNQVELEVYAARSQRAPENTLYKYELGLRMKRSGKTKDAIPLLQAARVETRRKAIVLLELGECFQKIEQFKLALSHYEQAIDACDEPDSEVRRLGLYRAGVLCTGLRELDRAERFLSDLAGLDYGYRDVAERLDKLAQLRNSE